MINSHNCAAKMQFKKQEKAAAGLVSEHFPQVSGMIISMTYYQKGANPVLMFRTINISPASHAYFKMDCMVKGCDGGGFDLTPVIAGMVETLKKVKKGVLVCCGNINALASDHASIDYDIKIEYNKPCRGMKTDSTRRRNFGKSRGI